MTLTCVVPLLCRCFCGLPLNQKIANNNVPHPGQEMKQTKPCCGGRTLESILKRLLKWKCFLRYNTAEDVLRESAQLSTKDLGERARAAAELLKPSPNQRLS